MTARRGSDRLSQALPAAAVPLPPRLPMVGHVERVLSVTRTQGWTQQMGGRRTGRTARAERAGAPVDLGATWAAAPSGDRLKPFLRGMWLEQVGQDATDETLRLLGPSAQGSL